MGGLSEIKALSDCH